MSFKCGICGNTSKPHQSATRIVMETRDKIYPVRMGVHKFRNRLGTKIEKDDPGGIGKEIAKEILICPSCAVAMNVAEGVLEEISKDLGEK